MQRRGRPDLGAGRGGLARTSLISAPYNVCGEVLAVLGLEFNVVDVHFSLAGKLWGGRTGAQGGYQEMAALLRSRCSSGTSLTTSEW